MPWLLRRWQNRSSSSCRPGWRVHYRSGGHRCLGLDGNDPVTHGRGGSRSRATPKEVGATVADETIASGTSDESVGLRTALENVVSPTALDLVGPRLPEELVIPVSATDEVVATEALDDVIACSSQDHIGTRCTECCLARLFDDNRCSPTHTPRSLVLLGPECCWCDQHSSHECSDRDNVCALHR